MISTGSGCQQRIWKKAFWHAAPIGIVPPWPGTAPLPHPLFPNSWIRYWWPHLIWPWSVLSMSPLLIWSLRHSFSIALAEFGLAAVCVLASAAEKVRKVSYDLYTDIGPTIDLLKKIYYIKIYIILKTILYLEYPHWEPSIADSYSSLRLLVRKLVRGS